jgi:hypothetical protein
LRLRYDGPGHVLDVTAWGHKPVPRGETEEFTEAEARALLANTHLRFTKVGDPPPVFRLTEVDRRGTAYVDYTPKPRKRGIHITPDAQAPEPEAESGEGQTEPDKQEENE